MRGFASDRRGNAAMLTAICGAIFVGSAGLAVDAGAVFLESRRMQGAADLAAIAAATSMNARAGAATVRANLGPAARAHITFGAYTPDPELAPGERFVPGGASVDAVRVTVERRSKLFFGAALLGRDTVTVRRTAVAAQARMGAFTLGTRLAAVRGGVANAMLSALTGSSIALSVMDYEALIAAEVSLLGYFDALRTDLGLEGVTYDDLLKTDIKAADALGALAAALAEADRTAEAGIVTRIALGVDSGLRVKPGDLIDLGDIGAQDRTTAPLDLSVSAFDLASMLLQGANASRQIEIDVPHAGLPGVSDIRAWLAIGEPATGAAWLTVGRAGQAQVRTSQARLYIDAAVASVAGAPVRLPVLVELAAAEARLADVTCGATPDDHRMRVEVRPALARVKIADIDLDDLDTFTRDVRTEPALVLRLPALRVRASADVRVGSSDWRSATFDGDDIERHAVKTVSSRGFVGSLASSAAEDMEIEASALGLPLTPAARALTATVSTALGAAAPVLDPVIDSLLATAGLSLGEADVRAVGVRCAAAVLVS